MAEAVEKKKEEAKEGTSRWWEFYVVRYALGTVFGVLIVNVLVKSGVPIPFPEGNVNELTKPEGLSLLLGYGLAYCYLASAPILVFHSARFSLRVSGIRFSEITVALLSGATCAAWATYADGSVRSEELRVLTAVAIAVLLFVILLQWLALIRTVSGTDDMWKFYLGLDLRRRVKENRELVDSYRHLREHGNAFFVVFLELVLGLGLYVANKVSIFHSAVAATPTIDDTPTHLMQTLILVLLWIVPATYVWTIGCLLERKFGEDESILPSTPSDKQQRHEAADCPKDKDTAAIPGATLIAGLVGIVVGLVARGGDKRTVHPERLRD